MANIKHFSDLNGETIVLKSIYGMPNAEFATRFPAIKGRRFDSFAMWVGVAEGATRADAVPVTRLIEYKSFPSRHECDARCINATGRVMRCECSCGGKNHGKGAFNCTAEAA
jgi:hypothetical protein